MSTTSEYIYIRSIKSGTKKSSILVRVIKQWMQKDRFNKETIELFLVDEEGSRIQATIPPGLSRRFKSLLDEGIVVKIRNFETTSNITTQYQKAIIDHPVKLSTVQGTKIEKYNGNHLITEHGFQFIPFSSFASGEPFNENLVVDVIGEVIKPLGVPEHVPAASNARKLDFKIIDHEGLVLDCTLWESYADRLIDYVDESADQPVVIIIQFGKFSKWNSHIRIQSMRHATKVYFSPAIPEILKFIQSRTIGGPIPSRSIVSADSKKSNLEDFFNPVDHKTIRDLINCNEAGTYTVWAQIDYVDHESKWYYDACGNEKCTKGVDKSAKIGDLCKKCNKSIPSIVPRFKLTVSVSDTELISSGGDARFVIFDKSSQDLLKLSASQVLENLLKVGDKMDLPQEFDALLDKKCLFRVEVDQKFNIDDQTSIFTVRKLTDDQDMLERFQSKIVKESEAVSRLIEDNSTRSVTRSNDLVFDEDGASATKDKCEIPSKRLLDEFEGVIDHKYVGTLNSTTKLRPIKKEKI